MADKSILGNARFIGLALATVLLTVAVPVAATGATPKVEAAFGKDCETLLIKEIERAKKEILVAVFSITRRNITSALADAVERGVTIRLKYDAESAKDDEMKDAIKYLRKQGVKCTGIAMSEGYAKMHHKFAVIDGNRVLTGSYNFTSSATTVNYENLVLIESAEIAKQFTEEFEHIKGR